MFEPGDHILSSELNITNTDTLMFNATSEISRTRILCPNHSSRIIVSNINLVVIGQIEFSDCQNMIATDIGILILQDCIFLSQNGNSTVITFDSTNAFLKTCHFYYTNNVSMNDTKLNVTQPALIFSYASNITIKESILEIKQGRILLAKSESNVAIIATSIINSSVNIVALKPNTPSALIQISNGNLYINGSNVEQNHGEVIIYARECKLNISNSDLRNNTGTTCILCSVKSTVHLSDVTTSGNFGNFSGIYLLQTKTTIINMIFSHNFGSLLVINSRVDLSGWNVFQNCLQIITGNTESLQSQGTLTIIQSKIDIFNNALFLDNYSTKSGGAIHATESKITIYNTTLIRNNRAENCGGGAFLLLSFLICHGNCTFLENSAKSCGGGIHTVSSVVSLSNTQHHRHRFLSFIANKAELGGGIYFETNSKLNCMIDEVNHQEISFLGNKAAKNGGAMFIKDETYPSTCNSTSSFVHSAQTECFFQVMYNDIIMRENYREHPISFVNNTARKGAFLYGGLLDRCSPSLMAEAYDKNAHSTRNHTLSGLEYFFYESSENIHEDDIWSDAVRVCPCEENAVMDCEINREVYVTKGEIFNVSVIAIDQVYHNVTATIRTMLSVENVIGEAQQLQDTNGQCTNLTFNISSPHDSVNLVLYADQGPCDYKGLSPLTVKVRFKDCNCPIGFTRSRNLNTCKCDLHESLKTCVEVVSSNLLRRTENCWINYTTNGTGYVYFIHSQCPYDYCLQPGTGHGEINFSDPSGVDAQCNFNHTGLLCGQCREGYSMSLGSSQCVKCPDNWPVLAFATLLFGAITGIVLVVLILWLDLTVALGTFNGMVFYANIVITNSSLFLPFQNLNFFTIFVYLLNTKLRVRRCFWEGMDVYDLTWFTYVYPLYIITLVISIIITCKLSSRFSNIIGKRNPVATLATMILASYTYLLRNTIEILSFTVLRYPGGRQEVVWLPDASVKYFQGKHIPLGLTAIAVVMVGLIYTTLLFSWQWLQLTPNIRMLRWIKNTKLSLFMEAYHAPYKPKYRYWTGLLLFVRVVHSIAVTISANPNHVLLATGILTAFVIIIKAYLNDRIYKSWVLDYLECTCYVHLLLLTLAAFYSPENDKLHQTTASISISVTFILFICTLLYHIHRTLSRSISRYKRLCDFIAQLVQKAKRRSMDDRPLDNIETAVVNRTGYSSTEVALTNIKGEESEVREQIIPAEQMFEISDSNSLREPLL